MGKSWNTDSLKGQSLVEMAIIAPLLIFILLGLLEVGYALRNYMIILNASRHGARMAARPNYLIPEGSTLEQTKADEIIIQTRTSMGELIDLGGRDLGAVVITLVDSEVNIPCDQTLILDDPEDGDYWPSCSCDLINESTILIENVWQFKDPITYHLESQINLAEFSKQAAISNDQYNCQRLKQHGANIEVSDKDTVVVEVLFQHRQLFGFPIISNSFTDPLDMVVQTTMRRNEVRKSPYE